MVKRQLSTEAADTLRGQILDGTLPAGSRLPGERLLSEQLGISRTALRDALQTLEATGFVEVRGGRGRYVAEAPEAHGSVAAMGWLFLHRNDLESLNEVRVLLEPPAVASIPSDLVDDIAARAKLVVDRQVQAVVGGQLHLAGQLDTDFHITLVSATPNKPLRELTEQLIGMARIHAPEVYKVPGVAAHSVAQHEEIVRALAAGDVDAAAELTRQHAAGAYRRAIPEQSGP